MGQYYIIVLLQKQATLQADGSQEKAIYDDTLCNDPLYMYKWVRPFGVKLMEHSYVNNPAVCVTEALLASNPKYVIWAGDYAEEVAQIEGQEEKKNFYATKYEFPLHEQTESVAVSARHWRHFLVNHSRHQYIVLSKYDHIHPLPLLTTDRCNGLGGGDYMGTNDRMCGIWRGDLISIEPSSWDTKGYSKVFYEFKEGDY